MYNEETVEADFGSTVLIIETVVHKDNVRLQICKLTVNTTTWILMDAHTI